MRSFKCASALSSDATSESGLLDNFPTQIAIRLVTLLLRNHGHPLRAIGVGLDYDSPSLAVKIEFEPGLGQMVEDNHSVIRHW